MADKNEWMEGVSQAGVGEENTEIPTLGWVRIHDKNCHKKGVG